MSSLGLRTDVDHGRDRRRARRAALVAVVLIVAVLAGVAGVGALLLRKVTGGSDDYPGPGSGSARVVVKPGENLSAIGRSLADAGVVKSSGAFSDAASDNPDAQSIQPGTYAMLLKMKASDAVTRLLDADSRVQSKVTVREGLRIGQTYAALAKATGVKADDYPAAVKAGIGLPDWAKGNPEGLLFPATYDFEPGTSAQQQLTTLVKRFDQAAQSTGLDKGVTVDGTSYSPYETLIVASILEKEARQPKDLPKVARVLYNRLAQGLRLQLDSTVSYVTGKPGVTTTAEDRAIDSPYNTYKHPGLPAGPITSPGEAAMDAALHPADGDWLYFVAVNLQTGETKYATTLAEHNRNVQEFRAWLAEHPQ